MFSSLEMDPGNSFQAKKKIKKNPKQPNKKKNLMYSAIFLSSVCILCMNESLLFIFFCFFVLYANITNICIQNFFVYKLFVIICITNICIQKYTNIGE